MASFNMGMGSTTSRAMSNYNSHRNRAISQAKARLNYPKIDNPPERVVNNMQATADQRFNQLNFSH